MDSTILSLVSVVALLLLSAFFSGSETALTAVSRARIHHLARAGIRRAGIVERLIDDRERLIGAVLLGNNLVNITASALTTSLFIALFGEAGVAYATLIMTALVLIFAEVMPKTYAITNPERMSLLVAPLVQTFVLLFAPVVAAVRFIVNLTLRLFGIDASAQQSVLSAREEIRGAIELHHREGTFARSERYMLGGVLDLDEIEISDVMVHRRNMMMLEHGGPPSRLIEQALASPYSRIPLWQSEPENIIGILHVRDLARALAKYRGDWDAIDILAITSEPWYVPETTTLREQLNAFRQRRSHFALVVDEYGTLKGLVTLEDILEEIVGDISDEHDIAVTGVRPQPDGSYVVDGWVTVRDLNRELDWNLPDEEAATVAGLVIHEAQTIPEVGQVFSFHGFKFEILRRQRNQITALRITPLKRPEAA